MVAAKKSTKKTKAIDLLDIWVLDRSGSMGGAEPEIIEGFNGYVNAQKKLPGKMWISLLLFDTQFDTPYVALPIEEVPELDQGTYFARGGTSLYDAVGIAIQGAEGWIANNPKFKGNVKITIWTDGQENSSCNWNIASLMEAIREKQNQGWVFAFNGSGGAAWTEGKQFANQFGAVNTTQTTATRSGRLMSYAVASSATSSLRGAAGPTGASGKSLGEAGAYNANVAVMDHVAVASVGGDFGLTEEEVAEALAGTSNKVE